MNRHLTQDIATKEDFNAYAAEVRNAQGYREPLGFGIFRAVHGQIDPSKIITGAFPVTNWNENFGSAAVFQYAAGLIDNADVAGRPEVVVRLTPDMIKAMSRIFAPFNDAAKGKDHQNVQVVKALASHVYPLDDYYLAMVYEDAALESLPAAYLKLGAMSLRKVKPRAVSFDGIFSALTNIAWSGNKVYELEWLEHNALDLRMNGEYPVIDYEDIIPRYTMMVPPEASIRILSSHSVRWGAYLTPGTTVMPGASYINFNAGTLEARDPRDGGKPGVMVEGRISSKATVGNGTDVGGGASIIGTLSGGNNTPVIIGEKCFLGANSVTGFSLGDRCIVDAGVSIQSGTKFNVAEDELSAIAAANPGSALAAYVQTSPPPGKEWKGKDLAGLRGLHFRMDSLNGGLVVKHNARVIALNDALHGSAAPKL